MNAKLKENVLPVYYRLLRYARRLGLLRKPQIKICISTNINYAGKTIPSLVQSLLKCGIAGNDIYVFEGGHTLRSHTFTAFHHYLADHNSIDFTALIEIVNLPLKTDYWFLLHDTCLVGESFKNCIQNIPHFWPQTMPVKNYPSMSMGAYRLDYLLTKKEMLETFRNKAFDAASVMHFKEVCIRNEDVFFKQSKTPVVYNGWLLNEEDNYRKDDAVIPPIYTNRICEYYPQVDVYKFKANYRLEQTKTVQL